MRLGRSCGQEAGLRAVIHSYRTPVIVAVAALVIAMGVVAVRLASPAVVTVTWETASEVNTAGFLLYRGETGDGPFELIVDTPIAARGDPLVGPSYEYHDRQVSWGGRYFYQLEEVERSGARNRVSDVVEVQAGAGWIWALTAGLLLAALWVAAAWWMGRAIPRLRPTETNAEQTDLRGQD